MLLQLGLALRNLLVQLVIVGLWFGLFRLLRLGLLLDVLAVGRLALLAAVFLLEGLSVRHNVLVVEPQLVGQPDGQGDGLGALDVDAADVAPLLRHPLPQQSRHHGVDVVGDLLGGEAGAADAHGGVGGGGQADEGGADGLLYLTGDLGGGRGVDGAGGLLVPLGPLAVDLRRPGLQGDGDGPLLGGLVEGLAKDLGQAVDDAVVGEEEVVLGEELALGLVLAELGPQLGVIDDAGDAAAQGGGEFARRDDVLVGALRVRGDEADAQQGGVVDAGQRVRQGDLAGLQAGLVGDVALGGQGQPDGGVLQGVFDVVVVVALEEVALGGGVVCFLLGGLLDVCEQSFGGFEGLRRLGRSV